MIPIKDKTKDILNVFGALLWVFLVVVSWIGSPDLGYIGLLAAALLCVIYFILGTIVKGKIGGIVPLIYPILIMALLWIIAFTIAYTTRGQATDTWILGLHPGQFWSLLLYWIGTLLTSVLGYALYFDKYILPDENWQAFLNEVKQAKNKRE